MIWVSWAQHRREALVSGLVLGSAAALLVITGLSMLADFDHSGVARCLGAGARAVGIFAEAIPGCDSVMTFASRWRRLTLAAPLALMTLPALFGVFIAAPLFSRELEQGTHLLAWSQSITRLRWAVVKLGLFCAAVVIASAALGALVSWWHGPLDLAAYDGQWAAFDIEGIAPVAYTVFALALGTLAGLVVRRTIPAMALTLFVFTGLRVLLAQIRPHFMAPVTGSIRDIRQGSWVVVSNYYTDSQGQRLSLEQVNDLMRGAKGFAGSGLDYWGWLAQNGIRFLADYHPADRFTTFQLIESAAFFGLGAALIAVSLAWLQRRA
jgi:ABC-type transport system involved in multi-copper enzyme maturation permease subunit